MKNCNVGIVGSTGAVGEEMINCLENLKIPVGELRLGTSIRSAGKIVKTPFGDIKTKEVDEDFFEGLDFALFSAGGDISKKFAPIATKAGAIVIDNSSYFRYDDKVPLVVPSINSDAIGNAKIIANPNCTTAIAAVALYPIYKKYGIKKIIMSTYQATSGAGVKGMDELLENTKRYFDSPNLTFPPSGGRNKKDESVLSPEGGELERGIFQHDIAFNVIPHIDKFQENGYTKEEMKVVWETHKIFNDDSIDISCTAVRTPTLRAHSESIVLETEKDVNLEDIKKLIRTFPGVQLVDDIENNKYPMPLNATRKYDVEVGRIRKSLVFLNRGLELFLSGDQLLRGAALNAVEILRECVGKEDRQ